MKYSANPVKPDLYDVLATAVYLAAVELADIHPQSADSDESIEIWKKYLLQQALKKQEQMTEEQRFAFRESRLK